MKFKIIVNIVTLAAIGLVVVFGWGDIEAAFRKMQSLDLWSLALFVPAQFFVFFSVAEVYRQYFKVVKLPVGLKTLLPTSIELNFVNHIFPSGGVSGFSYLTMRLKHDGVSTAKSTLAQMVRFGLAFLTFVALLIAAVVFLAVEDRASGFIVFVATALTAIVIFGIFMFVFIVNSESRINRFSRGLARFLNKIVHIFRRSHPETIKLDKVKEIFNELHKDYNLLHNDFGKMKKAAVWALLANLAEMSLIYITFIAHGEWVNPGAVIIAYGVATIAGLLAILPGGIGVYEPLMAGVLISSGISTDVALSVTLVSRVLSLALALGSGFILYQLTIRRYARHRSKRK